MKVLTTTPLSIGQQQARTRWGTHESGAAFDRKKTPYLTEEAQEFMVQQSFCVIAGLGPQNELNGLLAMKELGFVQILDRYTCQLQLNNQYETSQIFRGLQHAAAHGERVQLGLFFIRHSTRERLCVQGVAELLSDDKMNNDFPYGQQPIMLRLHVEKVFFHCVKYIRTRVAGLTAPAIVSSQQTWDGHYLLVTNKQYLSEEIRNFLTQQVLCFLCTVDREGQCAVNHRGGAPGFLVALPPDEGSPSGTLLLPDYAGNGAFEAIGNILETGQATIVVPNYTAQLALALSGSAQVLELDELSEQQRQNCPGAERVVALSVARIEAQSGDWSTALTYERTRVDSTLVADDAADSCPT